MGQVADILLHLLMAYSLKKLPGKNNIYSIKSKFFCEKVFTERKSLDIDKNFKKKG